MFLRVQYIMDHGLEDLDMVKEQQYGQTVLVLKGILIQVELGVKENLFIHKGKCMKENGGMIKQRDMVFISIIMEHFMKGCGIKTCSMEKEQRNGLMVLILQEYIAKERRMEQENTFGQIVLNMMVNGKIMIQMGLEGIYGQMEESLLDCGNQMR